METNSKKSHEETGLVYDSDLDPELQSVMKPKRPSIDPTLRKWTGLLFIGGLTLGFIFAVVYYKYLTSVDGWEPSTSSFHLVLIVYGLATMLPSVMLIVYVTVRGYTMQIYALQLMEQSSDTLGTVQSEIGPVVSDVKEVMGKVREIVERVEESNTFTEAGETLKKIQVTLSKAFDVPGH